MLNIKQNFEGREAFAVSLIFLFPLFANSIRHWVDVVFILLALLSLFSVKKFTYDLRKEEKIFLAIFLLYVLSAILSNVLAGWTYASHKWFFSGDIRFVLAIPIYLYIRRFPEIWKYLIYSLPLAAIIIGLTGLIDFLMRYMSGDVEMIFAEGVYGHIFQGNIAALWSILSYLAIDYFKDSRRMQMLCLSGAVMGIVGALVSVTRNAWLSVVLLYMIVFFLQGGIGKIVKTLGLRKVVLILAALVSILYFMSGFDYINDRLKQVYQEPVAYFSADRSKRMEDTSIGVRLEQWRGGLIAFSEKPLFGHGVGNIGKVNNRYIEEGKVNSVIYNASAEKNGNPAHIHNAYIESLADRGLVGFILLILVLYYVFSVAIINRKDSCLAWKFVVLNSAAFGLASLTEVPLIRDNWTSIYLLLDMVFFVWLMSEIGDKRSQS